MDTSDHAGVSSAFGELLRNADIQQREFATALWACRSTGNASAERLAKLVEAISEGDRAKADKVLRLWGVR